MSHKAAVQNRTERAAAELARTRRAHEGTMIWVITGVVLIAVVAAMLLTSRPQSSDATKAAPDFSLVDTAGETHNLSDHRGENVVLYFSEGAGCQSCIVQMGEIEKQADAFAEKNITVLPIVMNTKEQITSDMAANGVKTPFLLDDGTVSDAYGTIGNGMHAGLPGHSFVLIDTEGKQRWYGEYPSMWLAPQELLAEVTKRL